MTQIKPSEAELEILQIIWPSEPCTVRFVHEELCKKKSVGYTTTLKQIQRMVEKNILQRVGDEKTHQFRALIQEQETKNNLLDKFLESAFKGSAMDLVMHALGNNKTSVEELATLKKWLEKKEQEGGKS